jgi:hypothetical protein
MKKEEKIYNPQPVDFQGFSPAADRIFKGF